MDNIICLAINKLTKIQSSLINMTINFSPTVTLEVVTASEGQI